MTGGSVESIISGHGGLGGEAAGDLVHVGDAVAADVVDADVEDVGAFLLLLAGHGDAHVPVAGDHRFAELLRSVGVGALADRHVGELLLERREAVDRGGAVFVLDVGPVGRLDVLDGLHDRGDVVDGGAAAAADDAHAEVLHEPGLVLAQLLRREVVVHLPVLHRRHAGVGQAGDRHAGVLAEVAEVLAHLGRSGGAVDADDVGAHRVERGEGGADLGAGEHRAGDLHGHLHLDRQLLAGGGHRPAAGDHRRLGAEEVELGLDEEQVDAALEQSAGLDLVGVAQFGEADLAERRELGARAHGAGDEAAVAVGHLTGDAGGGQVELVGPFGDVVLGEGDGEGAERGGLDDVDADLEEVVVHLGDDVGPGDRQEVGAALERLTPEVVGGQVECLHVGAERAVVDDDALLDEVEVLAAGHGPTRLPAPPTAERAQIPPMTPEIPPTPRVLARSDSPMGESIRARTCRVQAARRARACWRPCWTWATTWAGSWKRCSSTTSSTTNPACSRPPRRRRSSSSTVRPRWNRSLCTSMMRGQSTARKSTRPIHRSSLPQSVWRRIGGSPARSRISWNRDSRFEAGGTYLAPRASTSSRNRVSPRRPWRDIRRSTAVRVPYVTSRSDQAASMARASRGVGTEDIPASCNNASAGLTTGIPSRIRTWSKGRNRTSWTVAPATLWSRRVRSRTT